MGSGTLKVQALSETCCNRWALECAEPHRSKQGMEELSVLFVLPERGSPGLYTIMKC